MKSSEKQQGLPSARAGIQRWVDIVSGQIQLIFLGCYCGHLA